MNRMAYADGYMPNLVGSTLYPDNANVAAAYANPYGYYAYDPTGVGYGAGYAPNPVFAANYKPNLDALSPNEADPASTQESLIGNVAQDGSDTTSITMEISKQFAGAILGPKGKTIVKLQRESGTIIRMSQIYPNVNTRKVRISGTAYGCSTAEYLVREVLEQKKREFFERGLFNPGKSGKGATNRKGD